MASSKSPLISFTIFNFLQNLIKFATLDFVPADNGKVICNLFGQERFGYGKQYTDIAALSKAMSSLADIVPTSEAIAMPYQIGCGHGGADFPPKSYKIRYP